MDDVKVFRFVLCLIGAAVIIAVLLFIATKPERIRRRLLKIKFKIGIAEDEDNEDRAKYLHRLYEYLYEEMERINDTRIDCSMLAVCAA